MVISFEKKKTTAEKILNEVKRLEHEYVNSFIMSNIASATIHCVKADDQETMTELQAILVKRGYLDRVGLTDEEMQQIQDTVYDKAYGLANSLVKHYK